MVKTNKFKNPIKYKKMSEYSKYNYTKKMIKDKEIYLKKLQ